MFVSFSPLFHVSFPSFPSVDFLLSVQMFVRYSREALLSFNRQPPVAILHGIYYRLRLSGLFLHRPTKRSRKRKQPISSPHLANLCLQNARSLLNKCEALNELFIDLKPDIVAITETWLTPTHGDRDLAACCPPGFSAVHAPRATGKGGGRAYFQVHHRCPSPLPP